MILINASLSELVVVTIVVRRLRLSFLGNKRGVDDDISFHHPALAIFAGQLKSRPGPECLKMVQYCSYIFGDVSSQPSDCFLRLHFSQSLLVSVCYDDAREGHEQQEIKEFIEQGAFNNGIDTKDPRWSTTGYSSACVSFGARNEEVKFPLIFVDILLKALNEESVDQTFLDL
jgi:hypothetical protein